MFGSHWGQEVMVIMFPNSRHRIIAVATLMLLVTGCSDEPEIAPSSIASCDPFVRCDTGEQLERSIQCGLSTGYYVEFVINVNDNVPDTCSEPLLWKCVLAFIDPSHPEAEPSYSNCHSLNPVLDPLYLPRSFLTSGPHIRLGNEMLGSAPSLKEEINEIAIPFSAFIGAPFERRGDFPYEVRLYPYFRPRDGGGWIPGDYVTIAEGVLVVND